MKQILIILVFLLSLNFLYAQRKVEQKKLFSDYARIENREKVRKELFSNFKQTFSGDINEAAWIDLFLEAELMLHKDSLINYSLIRGFHSYKNRSDKFNRQIIETAFALYPQEFSKEVYEIFNSTIDVKVFSAASHYLLRSGYKSSKIILNVLMNKYPDYGNDSILRFLVRDLENEKTSIPPITDLFSHNFQKNKTIIYSIHRKDRRFPGLTIIKAPDGEFVRNPDSSIFSIPQLALSATNLPGYMKNGNTPQGIFSVVGFYISPTKTIGPTPNVLTRIPFEVSTKIFYHNEVETPKWKLEDYKNLFPVSWQNYLPAMESFYAGKSGRRLIVMHGSVDDLSFYDDEPFFPLTPTLGCLTTKEIWNEDGTNKKSDQSRLMNAFFSTGELDGFLVVIEIDDKKEPVTIEEILSFIQQAER